jgi:hypothetical protein
MPNPEVLMDMMPEAMENSYDQIGLPNAQLDLDLPS